MRIVQFGIWCFMLGWVAVTIADETFPTTPLGDATMAVLVLGTIGFAADFLREAAKGRHMLLEEIEETPNVVTERYDWGTITKCHVCGLDTKLVNAGYWDMTDKDRVETFVRFHSAKCGGWIEPNDPMPSDYALAFAAIYIAELYKMKTPEIQDSTLVRVANLMAKLASSSAARWDRVSVTEEGVLLEWLRGDTWFEIDIIEDARLAVTLHEAGERFRDIFFYADDEWSQIGRQIWDVIGADHPV
jgi:hypothetical protein